MKIVDIYLPWSEIFPTKKGLQDTFGKIKKYWNESWKSLTWGNTKILLPDQIEELVNLLDQKEIQWKIFADINRHRQELLHILDQQTLNQEKNKYNDAYQSNTYIQNLKKIIQKYPYQIILENDNIDLDSIDFIKNIGNNTFSLRYTHNDKIGIVLVKRKWNIWKQFWRNIEIDPLSSSYKYYCMDQSILELPSGSDVTTKTKIVIDSYFVEKDYVFLYINYWNQKQVIYINDRWSFVINIDNIPKIPLEKLTIEQYLVTTEQELYTIWKTLWEIDGSYSLKNRESISKLAKEQFLLLRKLKYPLLNTIKEEFFPKYNKEWAKNYEYKILSIDWWWGEFTEIFPKKWEIQDKWNYYTYGNLEFKKHNN